MSATSQARADHAGLAPELRFEVHSAAPLEYAAAPALKFALRVETSPDAAIRSVLLDVQVQIAARQRSYEPGAQERLLALFGTPDRWASTLRTLPWLRTTLVVPPFVAERTVDLTVPCTYDLEVAASQYLAALADGVVPLEFLFSGSVFYAGQDGRLQMARIPWEHEASYAMPVGAWRATMDAHFPGSAWLRLDRERFDRLCIYKARHGFTSWEAAIDSLLAPGSGS